MQPREHATSWESADLAKRKFFSDFALRHKNLFRLHREYGVLAKEEGWRNVSEHCLVEAVAAETLAKLIGLSSEESEQLVAAAIVHDFYKRREIEAAKQRANRAAAFDESARLSADVMREHGLSENVIRLAGSVGHSSLVRMRESGVTLPEKLMHYIDDVTRENELVPLDARVDANEANPRYKDLNESGRALFGGKTYFEVQRETGHAIEKELADVAGVADPQTLPDVLRRKIEERIESEYGRSPQKPQ